MNGAIGHDEVGGIPAPRRPDVKAPPHWRLEDIFAVERPRHAQLSPDGASVVFILDRDGASDLWLTPTDGGQPTRLTSDREPMPYWEDDAPAWSPGGARLAYTDAGAVWVVPTIGGIKERVAEASSPVWLDDERLVVVVERDQCSVLALVADRWADPLAEGPGDYSSVAVAPDRTRLAAVFSPHDDLNRSEIHVIDVATREVTPVTGAPRIHDRAPAWSPDGRHLAYASEAPGWYEVHLADLSGSGAATRQLTTDAADFDELTWAPDGSDLVATRAREGRFDLVRVDLDGRVTLTAPGGTWAFPSVRPDATIVATHESATTPPRLVSVSGNGAVGELFVPTPLAISAAPAVMPEAITYPSSDGLDIPGFVLWGRGTSAERPGPAIVYPHGGPTSLYGDEWDGVAQYFVAKGYTWLAPNFRGSTTYGREFERANHGVWGVADTADCLAAYDWLATQPAVDPRRIGIFGASYGSYMALLSVVDDPEHRFACAAAKYGDCDIVTSWAQGDRAGRLDLERMMGSPSETPDAYRAGSPIHRIDNLRVPILVAHGEQDVRVNPAQSVELVEALRRLGKTYEYVTYPTEGHGFLRRDPFLDFYRRLERFLDWHLM